MAIVRGRLPQREDLTLVFGGCAFLVHIWAVFNLLDALPAFLLRMTVYELAGVISYVLVFALLESLVVWALLVMAAVVLPRPWLRLHFVSQGMTLALVTALWAVGLHFNYEALIRNLNFLPIWAVAYLVSTLVFYFLAGRYHKIESILRSLLQRVVVLSFLYVSIDILGIFLIVSRNL